jgi:hypothetical protein
MSSLADFQHAKWGGCKIKDAAYLAKETVSNGQYCSVC